LDLFTLRHSVCYFFCSGSLAVDPVDGTLNYVIALLLSPIDLGSGHFTKADTFFFFPLADSDPLFHPPVTVIQLLRGGGRSGTLEGDKA
jgi:hypothetical protein